MKYVHIIGIVVALALILFGIIYPVPEKRIELSRNNYPNESKWTNNTGARYYDTTSLSYQMEATLKAGYMSGVMTMKTVTSCSGILLLFITLYAQYTVKHSKKEDALLTENKEHDEAILPQNTENNEAKKNESIMQKE